MRYKFAILGLSLLLAAEGCRDSDVTGPGLSPGGAGTYIVNEGGFGGGGNLTFYDPATGNVSRDAVRTGVPWLFPNDILVRDGEVLVTVNGNDVVAIVDPVADSAIAEITFPPGTGPGLLASDGGRVYTANYDGTVSLLDPVGDSVVKTSTRVVGFPGAIQAHAGRVFVTDLGSWPDTGANVMVLDGVTLAAIDSVTPGGGMTGLVLAGGKLYVGAGATARIYAFDPVSLRILDSVSLRNAPADLATDGEALLVLTADAVERVPLATLEPDTIPLIPRGSGLFNYAMAYDPVAGEIYVSTVTAAGGEGSVAVYDAAGRPRAGPFSSGIFPGAFGFYRPSAR